LHTHYSLFYDYAISDNLIRTAAVVVIQCSSGESVVGKATVVAVTQILQLGGCTLAAFGNTYFVLYPDIFMLYMKSNEAWCVM